MKLIDKVVWFHADGYRSGKVMRVKAGKRIGLVHLRVRLAGADPGTGRLGHYGRLVTVNPRQVEGMVFRGKLVPIR